MTMTPNSIGIEATGVIQPTDLDIRVVGRSGEYSVTARTSDAEGSARLGSIPDESAVTRALLATGGASDRRGAGAVAVKAAQELGEQLFVSLFGAEVLSLYQRMRGYAIDVPRHHRLRLSFESAELERFPWEFLFDPVRSEFIGAADWKIVRRIERLRLTPRQRVGGALQILGVVASPGTVPEIDVDLERRRIDVLLSGLPYRDQIEWTWLSDPSRRGLFAALGSKEWHAVHFVGLGAVDPTAGEGGLVLAGTPDRAEVLGASDLARLLGDAPSVRLVTLVAADVGAPYTSDLVSTALSLVRFGLDAAVATRAPMSDEATTTFLSEFYGSVSSLAIDDAVEVARKAMRAMDGRRIEWAIPVLATSVAGRLFSFAGGDDSRLPPDDAFFDPPSDAAQGETVVSEPVVVTNTNEPSEVVANAEPTVGRRRSTYSSDQVAADGQVRDHLNMDAEVEALSWVTVAKDIDPPLAIGLFGAWGTGKSTFMQLMQEKVKDLTRKARAARQDPEKPQDYPACEHVRQITFNAWHYADANLWASLVTYIFEELARPGGKRIANEEYVELVHQLETTRSLREEAEQRQDAAREERARRIDELDGVRRSRHETAEALAAGTVDPKLVVTDPGLLKRAGEVMSVVGGSVKSAELGEWLSIVLTDPEFLNKAVAAIPDELVRSRLKALLEDAAFRERLAKAATSPIARQELVSALVKGADSDGAPTDDVARLGQALATAYTDAVVLKQAAQELSTFARQVVYLLRHVPLAIQNWRIAAVVVVGLAVAVVGVAAVLLNINQVVAGVAAFGGVVASVAAIWASKPIRTVRDAVGLAVHAFQAPAKRELALLDTKEQALQRDVEKATSDQHEAERELDDIRQGRRLYRYIEERAQAADYKPYLGVIAQVRRDFQRLTELIDDGRVARDAAFQARVAAVASGQKPELTPEQELAIDRVILYIDDLDRCPVDRVVQVLEAVHLLLALKLFVVVVGVDPRWLMRSLRNHYSAQLAPGGAAASAWEGEQAYWQSTPENYLEKIFQIPFTLRPMTPTGYQELMTDLLASSVAKPGGKETPAGASSEVQPASGSAPASAPVPPASVATTLAPDTSSSSNAPPNAAPGQVQTSAASPSNADGQPATAGIPGTDPADPAPSATQAAAPVRPATPPPPPLTITEDELTFIKALSAFVPTPRSAKRLANTYRLVRVLPAPVEARVEDDAKAAYRIPLTLLAILVGFPGVASPLFRDLLDGDDATWAEFRKRVVDDRANPPGDEAPKAEEGESADPREHEDDEPPDDWDQLAKSLTTLEGRFPLPNDLAKYRAWAGLVGRFSFEIGRITTVESGQTVDGMTDPALAASAKTKPAKKDAPKAS